MLVGYPVDGIPDVEQGQMFATSPVNATFTQTPDVGSNGNPYPVYTTSNLIGVGGNSGGPICVLYNGNYYPAAIYLGGTTNAVVRSIDSNVVNLFNSAVISGGGGVDNVSIGVTQYNTSLAASSFVPATVQVNFSPGSPPGAGWSLGPISSYTSFVFGNGDMYTGSPGLYTLYFTPVAGYLTPPDYPVTLIGNQPATVTIPYVAVSQTPMPFLPWEEQPGFFTNTQATTPSVGGPAATPQHDGISNLLKYVFNINPSKPMAATDRAGLPVLGTASDGNLTITFGEYASLTGINMTVQTSTDLKTWTTLIQGQTLSSTAFTMAPTGGTDPNGDPYMLIEVQPSGASKQFIRLNVSQ
jgi:hypothetical protein